MVSRTAIQQESSNSLVAMVDHSPLGARLRSEFPPTTASAPPRPSGASPLTGWFAISCVRSSPVTANSPSPHVDTSIVCLVTDYVTPPGYSGLSKLLNKANSLPGFAAGSREPANRDELNKFLSSARVKVLAVGATGNERA